MRLGIDIGSKNVSYALLHNTSIVDKNSIAHNGDITGTIGMIVRKLAVHPIETYGLSGSLDLPGIPIIDPVPALVEANKYLNTGARNILSIGCETFCLIILDENGNYKEHNVNSECASGTGSFIDQQAERLGYTTEELADKAYAYTGKTPSIASRCAVFAKSDIIHAQAQGFDKKAIAGGICEGVTRCVLANVIKGRDLLDGILICGGVSQNKKVTTEIGTQLHKPVMVREESPYLNAIGAAILADRDSIDLDALQRAMKKQRELRDRLEIKLTEYPDFDADTHFVENGVEITIYKELIEDNDRLYEEAEGIYIGLDIGSTSTKAIIIDDKKNILYGFYTRTKGDPVKAVSILFKTIKRMLPPTGSPPILGVGTTGSGRNLVKEVINADLAINEISAHAKGALFIDPTVDTIIEIGGQDSKFTLLKDGEVTNAIMNYVCAAGTGSFIEEQVKRLDITLDDISDMAIGRRAPFTSDRCTVYMERDLNIYMQEGWAKQDIIASVLFSVRDNYLSKVAGKNPMGNKVYFQGATAKNKALVAAFENKLEKPILVSRYCHLTGALGVSLYLMERNIRISAFTGIDFEYQTESEVCTLCANQCDLRVYTVNNVKTAWGLKCGRDYNEKKVKAISNVSQLERMYFNHFKTIGSSDNATKTVGIPVSIYMSEYYALFKDVFEHLGFKVVLEKSSPAKTKAGLGLVNSDFCLPITLMHGLVKSLLDKGVDYIFLPAIINGRAYIKHSKHEEKFIDKISDAYYCYYSQYASTIVDNLPTLDTAGKILSPKIKFNYKTVEEVADDFADELCGILNVSREAVVEVFIKCAERFEAGNESWRNKGREILSEVKDKPTLLLLGRPYTVFDGGVNLGIPAKLEAMGFDLVYQSMLDLNYERPKDEQYYLDKMHWYYGQQIMLAAEFAARMPGVYPVFLTCFRCSPDSYLLTYFKETMNHVGKPFLTIQLDEHTSDVGYQTRIEAGIETFLNHIKHKRKTTPPLPHRQYRNDRISPDDLVLLPYLSPIISQLQEAVFNAHGYRAEVLPLDQKMINRGYRYASGGECMPNVSIIGSLIERLEKDDIDPEKTAMYLPSGCLACNFNQFTVLADFALESAGFNGVKICNPNAARSLRGVPKALNRDLTQANILGSILYKLYFRFVPYEAQEGSAKRALVESLVKITEYLKADKTLFDAAREVRTIFEAVQVSGERKPRIGILGDLYLKYNEILNDDIYSLIKKLGGEVVIPSFTETVAYLIDGDVREHGVTRRLLSGLTMAEQQFEKIFTGLLDDSFEPPVEECVNLMHEYGIKHYITGETTINLSRVLYYLEHKMVSAVIHVNPVFCCPGVVSSSIFKKIQQDYDVPIINLFYDGTNKPNKTIVPHLYYL